MQNRILRFALIILLLLGISLASFTSFTIQAIGEVTPTPSPAPLSTTAPLITPVPDMNVDVPQSLGEAFNNIQSGNVEEALTLLASVIQAEPDNAEAYLLRSLAYSNNNQPELGIEDLTVAIDLVPETYHSIRAVVFPLTEWDLYSLRGNIYAQAGDNALALADYDAALRLSPSNDNAITFGSRAELNRTLGDTEAAEVDDLIAEAMQAMGGGDLDTARNLLAQATDTSQQTHSVAIAYYNLAIIKLALEDRAGALQDYSDAIRISPNMHIAYLARGISYRQTNDIVSAASDFYNRITILGTEFVDEPSALGEGLEIEMDYQRVVRITFEGTAGQAVSLSAREVVPEQVDPIIVLLDPNGNPIAGDDDFGGNLDSLIDDFELPATGTYTLLVSHAEGGYVSGFEGIVRVALENCSSTGTCA
jgi:tetratricopeptide (TPR) repeat protein